MSDAPANPTPRGRLDPVLLVLAGEDVIRDHQRLNTGCQQSRHQRLDNRAPFVVCRAVIDAASKDYVIAQGGKGASVKNSHGVAIYFPFQEVSPLYPGLDFCKKTGWDKFLKWFIATVRGR